ncbi:hypothetical protein BH23ACT10_BH23ACT10_32910 [soil metagenome]
MTATTDGGEATDGANGDLAGTTFAGREVHAVIGHDLVSTRYHASETEPDDVHADARSVALRVVAADLCVGADQELELYERFTRHAAQALTFEHPNASGIDEVGEHEGRGYLVTAELESIPFSTYLDRVGPLDHATALPLFEQIADVLDAGHRAGLTHGAVSPSTLRIVSDTVDDDLPTVQLAGHGIGALLELRIRRDRKRLEVVDDLLYVAPEQLRQQPSTGRTDQYAMACALVHALTGAPPFVRGSVGGLFGAHLFVEPRLDEHAASLPVHKALSKQPRERYATCSQLIADIQRAQRSAANRSRAALRRRRAAHGPSVLADAGTVVTALPSEIVLDEPEPDRVITVPEHNGTAPQQDDPSATDGDTQAPAVVDGDAQAPGVTGDRQPHGSTDDKSATARQQTSVMSYAADAHGSTAGPAANDKQDDLDDVPLLSEVLSQRTAGPPPTTWRPPGVWLVLMILLLVAAVATVWLLGT